MRVAIEVVSGPSSGKRYQVPPRQILTFGRTKWADVAFLSDSQMSSTHFSIECDNEWCLLKDLDSTNGTKLNDDFIKEAAVKDGDRICAGNTEFLMRVQANVNREEDRQDAPSPISPPVVHDRSRQRLSAGSVASPFTVEPCESGLTLFRGVADENTFEPSRIARTLTDAFSLVVIVHFEKFGTPTPEKFSTDAALFDWLPTEMMRQFSPVVFSATEFDDWQEYVDAGWDADAIVCVFSRESPGDAVRNLLNNMRRAMRQSEDGEGSGLLGLCWPSVLSQLLLLRDASFIEQMLGDFEAVFVEVPDLAASWQLFGKGSLENVLIARGFSRTADTVAAD